MDKVSKSTIFSKEFIDKLKEKQKLEGKSMPRMQGKPVNNSELFAKLKTMAEQNRKEGKVVKPVKLSGNSKLMQMVREAHIRQRAVEKAAVEKAAEIKGEEITDPVKENPEKAGE